MGGGGELEGKEGTLSLDRDEQYFENILYRGKFKISHIFWRLAFAVIIKEI